MEKDTHKGKRHKGKKKKMEERRRGTLKKYHPNTVEGINALVGKLDVDDPYRLNQFKSYYTIGARTDFTNKNIINQKTRSYPGLARMSKQIVESLTASLEGLGLSWKDIHVVEPFAGVGHLSKRIQEMKPTYHWMSDLSPYAVKQLKEKYENTDGVTIHQRGYESVIDSFGVSSSAVLLLDPPWRDDYSFYPYSVQTCPAKQYYRDLAQRLKDVKCKWVVFSDRAHVTSDSLRAFSDHEERPSFSTLSLVHPTSKLFGKPQGCFMIANFPLIEHSSPQTS